MPCLLLPLVGWQRAPPPQHGPSQSPHAQLLGCAGSPVWCFLQMSKSVTRAEWCTAPHQAGGGRGDEARLQEVRSGNCTGEHSGGGTKCRRKSSDRFCRSPFHRQRAKRNRDIQRVFKGWFG